MDWAAATLRANPELALFLTLAIGFTIGRIRIGSFRLGNVVGTLLAGVVVGQLAIPVDPLVKVVFFDLFLFATGYKVGPQFFRGLKKNALSQALLTLVLCLTSLVVTVVAAKVMGYDCGTAAGLMAGAFTESTVIGTAGDTIARLDLPEAERTRLLNNIPVAYAVSYLVGTGFVVWFLSSVAPRLLRVDLAAEARKLEAGSPQSTAGEGGRGHRLPGMGRAGLPRLRRAGAAVHRRDRAVLGPRPRVRAARAPRHGAPRGRPGPRPACGGRRRVRGSAAGPPRPGLAPARGGRGSGAARLPHDRAGRRPHAQGGRGPDPRRGRGRTRPRRGAAEARARRRGDPLRGRHRSSTAATCSGWRAPSRTSSARGRPWATSSGPPARPTSCSSGSASWWAASSARSASASETCP